MRGGVLELLEGCVLLEALREVLGGLRVQLVVAEAANTGGIECQRLLTLCEHKTALCKGNRLGQSKR